MHNRSVVARLAVSAFSISTPSVSALSVSAFSLTAHAAVPVVKDRNRGRVHDLKHPLGAELRERRRIALQGSIATGQSARGAGRSARVAGLGDGRYVELEQTRNDRVFLLLVEFGDEIHPDYSDTPLGPLHNQIAEPDRRVDNSTIWQPDFNAAHYADMIGKLDAYYSLQSSGRYGLDGQTTDWVKVRYNEARYGSNFGTDSNVWDLIGDGLARWVQERRDKGMTPDQIRSYLSSFDLWDRYDYDLDGNFDEPDGYIDHFLMVHAGEGEETGGGPQGSDAIWSHHWFAHFELEGAVGPSTNLRGGLQIGDTGIWVGDYTVQPENGGLGVFAHEFGHDLDLPDEYDTADGENSTGFWTLMSQGSYGSDGTVDLGSRPTDLNAWDKLQLGWLNAATVSSGEVSTLTLGPAEYNTELAQAVVVTLPDRQRIIELAEPPEGDFAWWSDMGNELDNSLVRAIDVPTDDPVLDMLLWYDIEEGWDFGYVAISADGGSSWENLASSVTTNENASGQNEGNGITGSSGDWVPASFDLADYAGQTVLLQLRYVTDPSVIGKGLLADAIQVGSLFDGSEGGIDGWTVFGFSQTTGIHVATTFNAYVAENRQYVSYDESLRTGPYNYASVEELPNWVEHYPYQNGLLVSYWDDFYIDNNTSEHPGEGLILPVDAHPDQLIRPDGLPWAPRIQSYDSTFGLEPTDEITLHRLGLEATLPSSPAVPLFDDLLDYHRPIPESAAWSPWASVIVPPTGTQIRVLDSESDGRVMRVQVRPSLE